MIDKLTKMKPFKKAKADKGMFEEVLRKPKGKVKYPKYSKDIPYGLPYPDYKSYGAYPVSPTYAPYKKYKSYTAYKKYPTYLNYPKYPTYTKYPGYPTYPTYPKYSEYPTYTTYPKYPGYPTYTTYPTYPTYPITKTPPPTIIKFPKRGVWGKKEKLKKPKAFHKYMPSLIAGMKRITTKEMPMPKIITGLGIRPVRRLIWIRKNTKNQYGYGL